MVDIINILLLCAQTKFKNFSKCLKEIKVLTVGASDGELAIDPQYFEGMFNLCSSSQDLKYSYLLLEKYIKQCPDLKCIILNYATFSGGWNLELNKREQTWAPVLNNVYNLELKYDDSRLNFIDNNIKEVLTHRLTDTINHLKHKNGYPPVRCNYQNSEKMFNLRIHNSSLWFNDNTYHLYIHKIATLVKEYNLTFVIVTSPIRSDFKNALKNTLNVEHLDFTALKDTCKDIKTNLNVDIKLIDLLNSNIFQDEDFGDTIHFNLKGSGPKKYTQEVFKLI